MAFETFLSAFTARVSEPSDEFPTVRCWKLSSLQKLAKQVSDSLVEAGRLKRSEATPNIFVNLLVQAGLAHPVPTEGPQTPSRQFVTLNIGDSAGAEADPFELLQALSPRGVICDFSALSFHDLTTQPATHHHIAQLTPPRPRQAVTKTPAEAAPRKERAEPDPLGTQHFRFGGVPFYLNQREQRLVPGIQRRWHGPKTILRITTREQALLDTLMRPQLCGGDTVVFGAWETAAEALDHERLAEYLEHIGSFDLIRRVGTMLELLEVSAKPPLSQTLGTVKASAPPRETIPLLPGSSYPRINERWAVESP